MPKRKNDKSDDYEHLYKKFRKLEKKLQRRRRRQRSRSSSRSSDNSYPSEYEEPEYEYLGRSDTHELPNDNITRLLDGSTTALVSEICADRDAEVTVESTKEPSATTSAVPITATAIEPSTSTVIIEDPVNTNSGEVLGSTEMTLASEILEILGEDPTISNTYGDDIHKDLAVRLEHTAVHGISKELRKELLEKYLQPGNCKLVDAPALNAEIKAAVSDMTAKRDKSIEMRQKQVASAISNLAQAINILISKDNTDPVLVKMLMDAERILCDCQHTDSAIRRNFILSTMKRDMKDQLQNTKQDNLLFGQNLTNTIKTAKAINRSGAELKTSQPKPQTDTGNKKFQSTASTSRNLNWKGPYPPRKPPNHLNHPRVKEPPPNRKRPSNSSRHSQQRRTRDRR